MGQDYSYTQPSSSDEFDITPLLEEEARLYADEADSRYNAAGPFQFPPETEAVDGIQRTCYGDGETVLATSYTTLIEEMTDFQSQLRDLTDQVHGNAWKLDKLESTVGELPNKKEAEVTIHGFALDVYVMVCALVVLGLAVLYLNGRV
ncbi:unnamed protein product [Eruca vesicaria subsp. sativa]|uniref:Uncharacterized protein n=1 Tax=Eruca vesicaria subsp. sativa TaxID=29727 RepID=A0ABC8L0B6_ERUVS|nr:unnamed protein product [Eruca vesicaria subsp. sativa]